MTKQELKQLRQAAGLSQEATARLLAVTLATYSRWEMGHHKISPIVERGIRAFFDGHEYGRKKAAK